MRMGGRRKRRTRTFVAEQREQPDIVVDGLAADALLLQRPVVADIEAADFVDERDGFAGELGT